MLEAENRINDANRIRGINPDSATIEQCQKALDVIMEHRFSVLLQVKKEHYPVIRKAEENENVAIECNTLAPVNRALIFGYLMSNVPSAKTMGYPHSDSLYVSDIPTLATAINKLAEVETQNTKKNYLFDAIEKALAPKTKYTFSMN